MIHLVRVVGCGLQLVVLLAEALVKLGHLLLIILGEGRLLLVDHFIYLREEVFLVPVHVHFALSKDLAHELRQVLQIVDAILGSLLDFIMQIPEIAIEIIHLEKIFVNERLLRLV